MATCKGKTKQGTRCRRRAIEGKEYCHQHVRRQSAPKVAAPVEKGEGGGALVRVAATTAAAAAALYVGAREAKRVAKRLRKRSKKTRGKKRGR